jgi:site-specific recombinase XerD
MLQSRQLAPKRNQLNLPAILAGNATPAVRGRVEQFFFSVASCFEAWVARRQSPNTQRAYREDVMAFVKFMGLIWPGQATELLRTSVQDVQRFRSHLVAKNAAPKTLNRRISSLSSFYKYLGAAAAELRLPITVPNPAHSQFISRESTDPREETRALSAARARQLVGLPVGNSVLDYRDRAILKFFLYSGARLSTVCRLKVSDFHQDGDEATIRLHEKGDKRRTIGLHFQAAQAIAEYVENARLTSGPLFRPRLNSRSQKLGSSAMSPWTLWRTVENYLAQLPGALRDEQLPDGSATHRFVYTPHSIRATAATLLLDAGVDIIKVKDLLGHPTSPPPRSTTSAVVPPPRAPATCWRFEHGGHSSLSLFVQPDTCLIAALTFIDCSATYKGLDSSAIFRQNNRVVPKSALCPAPEGRQHRTQRERST